MRSCFLTYTIQLAGHHQGMVSGNEVAFFFRITALTAYWSRSAEILWGTL